MKISKRKAYTVILPISKSYIHRKLFIDLIIFYNRYCIDEYGSFMGLYEATESAIDTDIENIARKSCDDVRHTLSCVMAFLEHLKTATYKWDDYRKTSCKGDHLKQSREEFFRDYFSSHTLKLAVGESGTTLRFFVCLCYIIGIKTEFTVNGRLYNRPINGIENCEITYSHQNKVILLKDIKTSQELSALLMIMGCMGDTATKIAVSGNIPSYSYVRFTLALLENYGIYYDVSSSDITTFSLLATSSGEKDNDNTNNNINFNHPIDYSSAAFWMVIMAANNGEDFYNSKGERIGIEFNTKLENRPDIGYQGDFYACELFKYMAKIARGKYHGEYKESKYIKRFIYDNEINKKDSNVGCDRSFSHKCLKIDCSSFPDSVHLIALLGIYLDINLYLCNIDILHHKESDRIEGIRNILSDVASIEEHKKNLLIRRYEYDFEGKQDEMIECVSEDHRIIMLAMASGILFHRSVLVCHPEGLNKSYSELLSQCLECGLFEVEYKKTGNKEGLCLVPLVKILN